MASDASADAPGYMTPGMASLMLGVPDGRLDRLLRARKVPYARVGRLRLIRVEDLDVVRRALGLDAAPAPVVAWIGPRPEGGWRVRQTISHYFSFPGGGQFGYNSV